MDIISFDYKIYSAFWIVVALFLLFKSFFIVRQQRAFIIERFGKFQSIRQAGLNMKIPFIDKVAGNLNLKIQQLDVAVETKTKDNVFVQMNISVQFQILKGSVTHAFYKLTNSKNQITSYVFDTVRAQVPTMRLDDVYEKKDEIANAIKKDLEISMREYGHQIIKALVTDIDPDQQVKNAMNKINASERLKVAAEYEAEAMRIKIVAKAEADAERVKLSGRGTADQRREIAKGLEESVHTLNKVGIGSKEASSLIIITQHYDTLQSLGEHGNSNVILMPNAPSTANDLMNGLITSLEASKEFPKEKATSKPSKQSKQQDKV